MAVFWLVLGVVLLLVELHHLAFYFLFVAVGSFAAAVVALFDPGSIPLQGGVAAAVAVAGVVALRPAVSRALPRHVGGRVARGVHGGLVGQEAVTLDDVGPPQHHGHVRLTGERWLAVSAGGVTIPPDTPVIVTAVEGTTLVVWPLGDLQPGSGWTEELGSGQPDGSPQDGADGRAK